MKALILKGKPGTGKGFLARKIASLIGDSFVTNARFMNMQNADTVIFDEGDMDTTKMKEIVTADPQHNFIFCTGSIDAVKIEEGARRFVVIDLDEYLEMTRPLPRNLVRP